MHLRSATAEGVHDDSFVDLVTDTTEVADCERTQSIIDPSNEEDEVIQQRLSDDDTDEDDIIYFCGGCQGILEKYIDQNLIACDGRCNQWFHMGCAGLTDADYQHFLDVTRSKWICSTCTPVSSHSNGQPSLDEDLTQMGIVTQTLADLHKAPSKSDPLTPVPLVPIFGNFLTEMINFVLVLYRNT